MICLQQWNASGETIRQRFRCLLAADAFVQHARKTIDVALRTYMCMSRCLLRTSIHRSSKRHSTFRHRFSIDEAGDAEIGEQDMTAGDQYVAGRHVAVNDAE